MVDLNKDDVALITQAIAIGFLQLELHLMWLI